VAKVLSPVTIAGITYGVLRLDGGKRGPRFLLRSDAGDLFGLYAFGAEPMRLYAVPLIARRGETNPLQRIELFDSAGMLTTREAPRRSVV
jgi:hypothetical protein